MLGLLGGMTITKGLILALLVTSVGGYIFYKKYQLASRELEAQKVLVEKLESNLKLVNENLNNERIVREKVFTVLQDLRGISDEEFNYPLPPGISTTLRSFRTRMLETDSESSGE